jgi:hypothetical protein
MQQTFTCPQCGSEFPSQAALNDHVEKEHAAIKTRVPQEQDPGASTEYPSDDSMDDIGANTPEVPTPERN